MLQCADCEAKAVWYLDDPGALATPYCDLHLPLFLRERAASGGINRPPVIPEEVLSKIEESRAKGVSVPRPRRRTATA